MMAVMAISAWVGYKLDQWLSIEFPVFTLGFTVVAIGLVLYKLVKSLS
jgi:hypothetical protein